jgi:enoyl-[acyl-carrier protein] reductase III
MSTNLPFQDKVTLVTGSGRGIGKAIAYKFAQLGSNIVLNYVRNKAQAEETCTQIKALGRKAILVAADVSKIESIDLLFQQTGREFGGLDFFISNAASGANKPGMQQQPGGWDYTMNTNARSFLFAAQCAAPLMDLHKGGVMLAITSPGSQRVLPDYISVGASKAALESLVRYLSVELAPRNIVVNAISPGMVLTDALRYFQALSDSEMPQKAIAATPAGRLVTPEDIANLAVFLCTPQAEMIRGQVIVIDGGFTLPARV